MRQFDRQIRDSFMENLNSVHASEDLIRATLRSISVVDDSSPKGDDGSQFSAINTRYVREHLKNEEKKLRKQRIVISTLISSLCAAAVLLIVASSIFAVHRNAARKAKDIPFVSYVTFQEAYYFSRASYYETTSNVLITEYSYDTSMFYDDSSAPKDLNDPLKAQRTPSGGAPGASFMTP